VPTIRIERNGQIGVRADQVGTEVGLRVGKANPFVYIGQYLANAQHGVATF
jgi:hypothetical protein